MRILYDGHIYQLQPTGGISRYFSNIISRLPTDCFPTLLALNQAFKLSYPIHSNLKNVGFPIFRPYRVCYDLSKYYFRCAAYLEAFKHFNIAHPTYYSLATHQEVSTYSYPVVITVHDMIHELFSEHIDPSGQYAEMKKRAVSKAHAILCVSENTKKDLIEQYSIPESQITVTHLASEIGHTMSYGAENVPHNPYYLYVGSRDIYKNFHGLLSAFAKTVSVNPNVVLCVVGRPFQSAEMNSIEALKLSNHIEHYGQVTDSHLAKLYRCSVAFVYPSLYEGFGIPPLEAMSCGTPVIASNSSSIPEVIGDAGILFNPKATADLADILLSLLDSPAQRETLIAKGYKRAKKFSWDTTASQTLEVYRSLAN